MVVLVIVRGRATPPSSIAIVHHHYHWVYPFGLKWLRVGTLVYPASCSTRKAVRMAKAMKAMKAMKKAMKAMKVMKAVKAMKVRRRPTVLPPVKARPAATRGRLLKKKQEEEAAAAEDC